MIFQKNQSEGKELWIISLDFDNGKESEEFVETSKKNALEKIKDLVSTLDDDDIDYISVAKVKIIGVACPTTSTIIGLE